MTSGKSDYPGALALMMAWIFSAISRSGFGRL
jgi:hypothetical protein